MRSWITLLPLCIAVAACTNIPQAEAPRRPVGPSAEARQCHARLSTASATFTPLPDQYFGAGCSTINTVRLAAIRGDTSALGLSNLGPVSCPLADAFAAWARFGVDRAARQVLGSQLVRIETMGSYSCRNVAGTDRRSAHSSAEAIDIAAFVLADGRRISVLRNWSAGTAQEREFLRLVHSSACKRFGTVLSPEYNAAHRDHLHVELGGGSFCR